MMSTFVGYVDKFEELSTLVETREIYEEMKELLSRMEIESAKSGNQVESMVVSSLQKWFLDSSIFRKFNAESMTDDTEVNWLNWYFVIISMVALLILISIIGFYLRRRMVRHQRLNDVETFRINPLENANFVDDNNVE